MKYLKGRDVRDRTIEQWFIKRQPNDLQELKTDYVARYKALRDFLVKEVHPYVATGAAVYDGIFLNNHGPEHIATVITRASQLLSQDELSLSAYEVYILLSAIQLHDAGNILGRPGHEARLFAFQGQLEGLLGGDTAEKRTIKLIAKAHGGKRNGDPDTIGLLVEQPVLNQPVRARLLAAILRFADEIADDSLRTSTFALAVNAIPASSLLYHRYSASLQSVMVDTKGRAINLHFDLTRADVAERFEGNGSPKLLLDEILTRTLKMHRARTYCMRFLRPLVQIDSINVKINIYESNSSADRLFEFGYRLEERGYPDNPPGGVYELCPELNTDLVGTQLNGENLISSLEGITNEQSG